MSQKLKIELKVNLNLSSCF